MGFALFRGPELRDWGVKNIGGKSKEKMGKAMTIISGLLGQHEPDVLALKELHPSRSSSNLNRMVARTKELAKRKGVRICQYPIKELESGFHSEKINRRELAEIVASDYPVLSHDLNKEKTIRNPYYIRMFEAVALGSLCFHQLDRRRWARAI